MEAVGTTVPTAPQVNGLSSQDDVSGRVVGTTVPTAPQVNQIRFGRRIVVALPMWA